MRTGILTLTEREKETLRLLVSGHDAKSIARHLELSVHTVNERLRNARRKLDVSSSREAARLLAEAEQGPPDFLADTFFGVADEADDGPSSQKASSAHRAGHRLVWLSGGMFIMSLVIAAVALSSAFHGNTTPDAAGSIRVSAVADASASASLSSAREWVSLLDRERWEETWRTAAALFKSQITASQWASTVQSVRQPLGPVSSRTFQSVTKANSLPGAPAGEYEILQFQTDFARKSGAIETVILARDPSGWRVAGYFIR
ncbi:helix-turn-helix domain-containing protein [Altericroceibacterium xinjiangense]|uniref:helix-turn-helix domain-containing protein n=1 Tax=Altericroceibacterium xinjiangense TaxID=762261 RepID=UPI000F7E28B4|nr:DUF4019 domain-containing protein [Altericroceibacterium xinjiangense]